MALPTTITGFVVSTLVIEAITRPFVSSGGNVYVFGRSSTAGEIKAVKATDPTSSFSGVGTDFATTSGNSINSIDAYQVGDNIHVVTSDGPSTATDLRYHIFSMSSDSWTTTNELIKDNATPVSAASQSNIQLSVRSDGDVIVLYNGSSAASMGTDYERVYYARRESGSWTIDVAVDNGGADHWYSSGVVIGSSDRMHFFLINNDLSAIFQRTLTSANALQTFPSAFDSTVSAVANSNSQLGVSYDSSGTQKVRFPFPDNTASTYNSAKCDSADAPTMSQDNDITGATDAVTNEFRCSFVADGTTLWNVFIDSAADIYTQSNENDGGWSTPESFVGDSTSINGVKPNIYTRGSSVVIGMIYLLGTSLRYHEKQLSAGTTDAAFDLDATASVTWSGRSTAASNLDSDATASVTWVGASSATVEAAFDLDATAIVTWNGRSTASSNLDSDAAATLTWNGTGLYPAAFDSDAAATLTWNGAKVAASALSSTATALLTWNGASTAGVAFDFDAAATLTWNGAAEATSAWSSTAAALLTWNGTATASADWSSTAAATLTWVGEEIAVTQAAFDMAAVASVTWNGTSDATATFSMDALATLTWDGESTATSALAATALASLTWNGTATATADWSAAAASSVTWNGEGIAVTQATFDMAAVASVTWGGEAIAAAFIDTDIDAFATLRMVGGSIRSADLSAAAVASVTWNGVSTVAASWSASAIATQAWNGNAILAAAWSATATASVAWDGEEVSGAFSEGAFSIDAMASVTFTSDAIAASAFQADAVSVAAFVAEPPVVTGHNLRNDGWRRAKRRQEELEAQDEEDMMVITAMILAYLEQNHGYY